MKFEANILYSKTRTLFSLFKILDIFLLKHLFIYCVLDIFLFWGGGGQVSENVLVYSDWLKSVNQVALFKPTYMKLLNDLISTDR